MTSFKKDIYMYIISEYASGQLKITFYRSKKYITNILVQLTKLTKRFLGSIFIRLQGTIAFWGIHLGPLFINTQPTHLGEPTCFSYRNTYTV